jgi:hypothetical protein
VKRAELERFLRSHGCAPPAGRGLILCGVEDPQLIELKRLHGTMYDIEATEDGRYVLTSKLTAAARRARLGTVDISDEEFEQLFGGLPTGPA